MLRTVLALWWFDFRYLHLGLARKPQDLLAGTASRGGLRGVQTGNSPVVAGCEGSAPSECAGRDGPAGLTPGEL